MPIRIPGVLLLFCGAASMVAQIEQATIVGAVTDQTGSVIGGASVTVRNTGTGERRTTHTDDRGNYQVTALNIGSYEVSVEQKGFSKQTVSGIRLIVNQVARVDVQMQIGQVAQETTVSAAAALVQTDDATISQYVNQREITELPIPANRNLFRLALMGGGMSPGPASSVTTSGFGPGFGIAAYGQKVHDNWIILDDAPLKTVMHGEVRMRPSVEALQEFRVEAGFYNADLGTTSGAQIISAIRPGTNQFHATLFEFLRNDKLDAENFFEAPTVPKQPLRRNNFGGVVSGRIIRDKLFFTANYEGYIERLSSQAFGVYPTASMIMGDLNVPFYEPGSIHDALNGGAPFPNNQIPSSRLAPESQKLAQFFPAPNLPGPFTGANNYTGKTISNTNDHQGFLRVDYNINANNRLFARYGIERLTLDNQPIDPNPYFAQSQPRNQQNIVTTWTRILSPTRLNELTLSYNRDIYGTVDAISGTNFNIAQDLGIPGLTTYAYATGVPSIILSNVSGFGTTAPNTIWDENRRIADTFSFSHGPHAFKAGVDHQRVLTRRQTFQFVTGTFNFTGSQSGSDFADFLLDWPNQVREATGFYPGLRAGEQFCRLYGWRLPTFITDDWKVTSRLTISMGLRWELNSPVRDTRGLTPNFNFATDQLYPALFHSQYLYNWDHHDFAPRFGLAFRPFGGDQTVIRASYGVFYNVNMWNNFQVMDVNPPFLISINQLNTPANPVITMANAYLSTSLTGKVTPEVLGVPQDYGMGNTQMWTFNIQRAIPHNILLEADYIGSKSTHYDRPAEYNLINVLAGQTTRPLPEWGDIEFIDTDASATYEAGIVKAEERMSHGLTFLASYTYSKTLNNSFSGNGANRLSDPFNAKAEKGLAETDVRSRVTGSALYELPFYQGKHGLVAQVLGGWQANGVFTWETGMPMYPVQATESIPDGCPRCNPRPDILSDPNLSSDQRTLQRWFNTSAFKTAVGHYGNAGRNILTAPGLTNLDFSLFKNFNITEAKRFQFRWEMYNATNTPPFDLAFGFASANLTVGNGTFGQVTSAGSGRVMQFGLRYEF